MRRFGFAPFLELSVIAFSFTSFARAADPMDVTSWQRCLKPISEFISIPLRARVLAELGQSYRFIYGGYRGVKCNAGGGPNNNPSAT